METRLFGRERARSSHIQLDTRKCKACWKCLEVCQNEVIGKVDLLWHKHALIIHPENCTGCLKCSKSCQYHAISRFDKAKQETERPDKRVFNGFIINNLLLIAGIIMIFSGLVMQLGFHAGGHNGQPGGVHRGSSRPMPYEQLREINTDKIVNGLNYHDWSTAHKFAIVCFSLLMIYHICVHWKWYKAVIRKNLMRKNSQVITLSVLFLMVAVTGLLPWSIDLSGGTTILRLLLIEIHDKLALVLVIYLVLHVIKRYKWFMITYAKLK